MAVEVAVAAEELREEVERVMCPVRGAARLPVALDALMAVLVVDAAQLRVDEGLVGGRNLDKLLLRRRVIGVLVGVVLLREAAVGGFYGPVVGLAVDAQELVRVLESWRARGG